MAHSLFLPLLRRFLKLPPEVDLDVRVRDCKIVLTNVAVKTGPLCELFADVPLEAVHLLPLEVSGGSVGDIAITWSWRGLLVEPFQVTVRNPQLSVGVIERPAAAAPRSPVPPDVGGGGEGGWSMRMARRILQTLQVTVVGAAFDFDCPDAGRIKAGLEHFSARPQGDQEIIQVKGLVAQLEDVHGQHGGGTTRPLDPVVLMTRQGGRSLHDLLGLTVSVRFSQPSASLTEAGVRCAVGFARFFDSVAGAVQGARSEGPASGMEVDAGSRPVATVVAAASAAPSAAQAERAAESWGALFWGKFRPSHGRKRPRGCEEEAVPKDMTDADIAALADEWVILEQAPETGASCKFSMEVEAGSLLLFERSRFSGSGGADFSFTLGAPTWRGHLRVGSVEMEEPDAPCIQLLTFPETVGGPSLLLEGPQDLSRFDLTVEPAILTLAPEAVNIVLAIAGLAHKVLEGAQTLEHQPAVSVHLKRLRAVLPTDGSVFLEATDVRGSAAARRTLGGGIFDVTTGGLEVRTDVEVIVSLPSLRLHVEEDPPSVAALAPVELSIAADHLLRLEGLRNAAYAWVGSFLARVDVHPVADVAACSWTLPEWSVQVTDGAGLVGGIEVLAKGEAEGRGTEGSVRVSVLVDQQPVLSECSVRWDEQRVHSSRVSFTLQSSKLRMLKVFAEGIATVLPPEAPETGPRRPAPRLEIDCLGLQVLCPKGLHVVACGEKFSFCGGTLQLHGLECRLQVEDRDAALKLDGAVCFAGLGEAAHKEVVVEGSFRIDDGDACALLVPAVAFLASCDEQRGWAPGAKVRLRRMRQKASEGKCGTLVAWDADTRRWRLRLDGREAPISLHKDKLCLCALPWDVRMNILQPVELQAADDFTNWVHEHALILADICREVSLVSTTLHQRPFGLRIHRRNVVAVAGPLREVGMIPGGRVVAVGSERRLPVDLATCPLPAMLLTSPAPPEVVCNWSASAFELVSRRLSTSGGTALESKASFREVARTSWGPGLMTDLLRDVQEIYAKSLLIQSPQLLANMRGDFVEGATSALLGAVSGVNLAVRQTRAGIKKRESPVVSYDDLGRFPAEDILRALEPADRLPSGIDVAVGVGNFVRMGVQSLQESLNTGAPGSHSAAADRNLPPPTAVSMNGGGAPPAPSMNGGGAPPVVTAGVQAGMQLFGDLSRVMNQVGQAAAGGRPAAGGYSAGQPSASRGQAQQEPCKQQ